MEQLLQQIDVEGKLWQKLQQRLDWWCLKLNWSDVNIITYLNLQASV